VNIQMMILQYNAQEKMCHSLTVSSHATNIFCNIASF